MKIYSGILFIIFTIALGCQEQKGMPKPRAYPRVEYPERKYVDYHSEKCPFTFQYPGYAEINEKKEECWFDLFMPVFQARIHCSYIKVKDQDDFYDLIHDSFEIAKRINDRANYMEETRIENEMGVHGLMLEWSGPAASPVHFFLTDSTAHFFKAALYFDAKVRPDSLAPISAFIKEDINHMISTFNWDSK